MMSTPTDYFNLAEAYAEGVRSLLEPPAAPGDATDRAAAVPPPEQLADRAERLLPVSGGLNGVASARLNDADPTVRADAEVKLLAKAATDLEVAIMLLDAAESEREGARAPGASARQSLDRAGGGNSPDVEENLSALLSQPAAAAAVADRSSSDAVDDVDAAREESLTQVRDTLELVTRRAAKSGQASLGGLIGLGAMNLAGAVGTAGQGLANVLGVGETVGRWYNLVRSYAVNAYEAVMALLGSAAQAVSQKVVEWVNELTGKWTSELKGGKLLGTWLEKLYETEATKSAVGKLAAQSTADPAKFVAVAEEAKRLRESYEQQIKWADKVLEWVPRLSGPVMLALPHGTLIVAVLYVALGGYVIVAGADYVDAPRVNFLNRVPGVRQVAESSLGGA